MRIAFYRLPGISPPPLCRVCSTCCIASNSTTDATNRAIESGWCRHNRKSSRNSLESIFGLGNSQWRVRPHRVRFRDHRGAELRVSTPRAGSCPLGGKPKNSVRDRSVPGRRSPTSVRGRECSPQNQWQGPSAVFLTARSGDDAQSASSSGSLNPYFKWKRALFGAIMSASFCARQLAIPRYPLACHKPAQTRRVHTLI